MKLNSALINPISLIIILVVDILICYEAKG